MSLRKWHLLSLNHQWEFDEKLALLEQLLHMWEQGEEVVLSGVSLTISESEGIDSFVC